MTIQANPSILRRKMRSEPKGAQESAVSPAKAARLSLARAADKAFELPLRVSAIRQSRLDLADVVDSLEDSWAIYPLVNDDGSIGIMCFDPACVIAFMETQTMGNINNVATQTRAITRTDKALVGAFLEVFFNLFDDALLGAPTAYWTRGYRAEDAVASRHMMVLLLEASEYRGFDMNCMVAGLDHPVSMRLFLPIKEQLVIQSESGTSKKKAKKEAALVGSKTMRGAALSANVALDAVMCKVSLPLSELNALQPGHVVRLPQNAAAHAQLIDPAGQTTRAVHLGQLHGMRAVRLVMDTSEEAVPAPLSKPIETLTPSVAAPQEQAVEPPKTDPSILDEGDGLDALLAGTNG